jgi:hypothetical protein
LLTHLAAICGNGPENSGFPRFMDAISMFLFKMLKNCLFLLCIFSVYLLCKSLEFMLGLE